MDEDDRIACSVVRPSIAAGCTSESRGVKLASSSAISFSSFLVPA